MKAEKDKSNQNIETRIPILRSKYCVKRRHSKKNHRRQSPKKKTIISQLVPGMYISYQKFVKNLSRKIHI